MRSHENSLNKDPYECLYKECVGDNELEIPEEVEEETKVVPE